jgi:predicted MFS family arabinose efflux permease
MGFAGLEAAAIAALSLPALGVDHRAVLLAAAAGVAWTGGMATAALYTAMMDAAAERTAGTDFTVQQSLAAIGPMLATGLSGFVVSSAGYAGVYVLAAAWALAAVALVRGMALPRVAPRGIFPSSGPTLAAAQNS